MWLTCVDKGGLYCLKHCVKIVRQFSQLSLCKLSLLDITPANFVTFVANV